MYNPKARIEKDLDYYGDYTPEDAPLKHKRRTSRGKFRSLRIRPQDINVSD